MNDESLENIILEMILDQPNLINGLYVQDYFYTKNNKEMLNAILEEYQNSGTCDFKVLVAKKPEIQKLFIRSFELTNTSSALFDYYQQGLIEEYKNYMVKELYAKYNDGKLDRDQLISKVVDLNLDEAKASINFDTFDDLINEFKGSKELEFNKFKWLTKELNLSESVMYIIGATPATGKTALALTFATDLAKTKDYQVVYFHYEMPKKKIDARIVGSERLLPVSKLEDPKWLQENNNYSERSKGFQQLVDLHLIYNDTITYATAIKNYLKGIKRATNKHLIVFIDTINYVDFKGAESEYEKATKATRSLMTMCKELECTCFLLAHIKRDAVKIDMAALKSSGELEQSASAIFLLTKEESDEEHNIDRLKMMVAKNRDGMTKDYYIDYYKTTQRMEIS